MDSNSIKLQAILVCALLFNLLFWQEKLGINLMLFDLVIGISIFIIHPGIRREKTILLTGIGTLLMALLVIWNNTLFAKVIHLLSVFSFIGFVQVKNMEFIGTAFGVGLSSLLEAPLKMLIAFTTTSSNFIDNKTAIRPFWRWAQLSIIPIVLVSIFYSLYALANPAFANLSGRLWDKLWISTVPDIDFQRVLFFLIGLVIATAMLWPTHLFTHFKESIRKKVLSRNKKKGMIRKFKLIDLKMEYRSALILMAALNVLLFVVNAIDFWYVWLGFGKTETNLLSQYVHEGTWLLIMAIFLGMFVLGYYFRKNLNFYPGNELLKVAAYSWIIQNAILAFSVAMRNFRYIEHYGLAYKRLGVMLFLCLVLIGLFTMYLKVSQKKTFYYLFFQNAWACYFVLILASSINWDVTITRYNLSGKTKSEVDMAYLVGELSDKNLFVLYKHFPYTPGDEKWDSGFRYRLDKKREQFLLQQNNYSWLSWNYADYKNLRVLNN